MRGYFGIGVEGISKAMNAGALFRTAHAFGAGFVFTVNASYSRAMGGRADTSSAAGHIPFYGFPSVDKMILPTGCRLVGVELTDDAIELPSFHHPARAAYVMGPERASLSAEMQDRCDFIVKIPTKFCINVSLAGALVMYDRTISLGNFARRAVQTGAPTEPLPDTVFGNPIFRKAAEPFRQTPPDINNYDPDTEN